jgi:hypothetical protein
LASAVPGGNIEESFINWVEVLPEDAQRGSAAMTPS